jgi:hypothetical protein
VQCNRCSAMLPPGASSCPYCANPTPYNVSAPPPSQPGYGQPPYGPPQGLYGQPPYGPPQGLYGQPVMMPRKQSGCSTAAIIVGVILLVLVCGGSLLGGGMFIAHKNAAATVTSMNDDATTTADDATYTTELTPTPYPPYTESQSPSGATFSEPAQQIVPTAQLASAVDSSTYRPTELQSTFQSGQAIYLVYNWAMGNTGYVQTRWYLNGEMKGTNMSKYIGQSTYGYGYMGETFYISDTTNQGTVEVFWCQDDACAHGGLAWARPFSVIAS